MKKVLVCIGCPKGCRVSIDTETLETYGNACPRGAAYAKDELTNPTRTLTSTVAVSGAAIRRCPVKTDRPIAKSKLLAAAEALGKIHIAAPVRVGDVLAENFADTGANLVATRTLEKAE